MEERFSYFEAGLSALAQEWMTWRQLSFTYETLTSSTLNLDSVNLGRPVPNDGVAENNHGSSDRGTTPMDIEEEPPNHLTEL
jgi:hypothetical protein